MSDDIKNLKNVLQYLNDSVKGLTNCAEHATNPTFKANLTLVASQRHSQAEKLNAILITLDEKPVTDGTLAGPLHRVYIDLKSFITSADNESIKSEVIRGDETLIKAYNEAIINVVDEKTKTILSEQLNQIHKSLVTITNNNDFFGN